MLFRLGFAAVLAATAAAAQDAAHDRFEKEIRPVLAERCYPCHSSSAAAPQGGLLLDSADGIRHGGNSGAVVRPGEPDLTLLIRAIRYTDSKLKMPPGRGLPPEGVANFGAWVREGAPLPADRVGPAKKQPALWSLKRPVLADLPAVRDQRWIRNDVDRFILSKLEANH